MRPNDTDWLWGFCWNTHVGQQLHNGGVRWVLGRRHYDFALLQEVQSPAARAALHRVFPPLTWSKVGTMPPSWGRGASGTIVLARRKRLRKVYAENPQVSPYRDRMHPERRATRGVYQDRRTGALVDLGSVHTWAGGGAGSPQWVQDGRQLQRNAHAKTAKSARGRDQAVLRGGDWNERVGTGGTRAEAVMAAAGLHMLGFDGKTHLDAIFAAGADVKGFERIQAPARFHPESQHPILSFAIRPDIKA